MIFETIVLQNPQAIALKDTVNAVSYGALMPEIVRRAAMLADAGALGLAGDNSVEWILWDLAALHAGVPCVPLPPFFTPAQIQHAIQSAGITHLLTAEGRIVPTGAAPVSLPSGTAKVTFTSGTTGTPKGVCLPQKAMENVAGSLSFLLGGMFSGVHACALPLAVLLENVAGVYAGLMAGRTIHIAPLGRFGAQYERLHAYLDDSHAASVILVPELLKALIAQTQVKGRLKSLRFAAVGGAKVEASLIETARALDLPVYEGYGLSECASVVSLNLPGYDKPGTAGRLLPHVKAGVQNGEIIIRQPGFLGYVGSAAPQDYATGDLGQIDADGYVTIAGRKKNVLITSYGRNVSPEWVEAMLLAQPAVAQAFVYGDAQPHLSALIVPAGADADIPSAVLEANAHLPDYARVADWRAVSPFTRENGLLTGNGRMRRDAILNSHHKEKSHEFL